ncbi:peptidoglycan -binding protein [Marivivens sp. LCG002]|uniref:peptidoglycan -binding protein n=1 Tax=Marivivens sp. LCG002 TaxID=3051171 RepID=UPI002554AB2E|nr:peptidoglycan -binding protein [Marivivens sp. LCG002]WIV50116.1 peptidoglycan -binding protein [Marivivens sp. LCG002]
MALSRRSANRFQGSIWPGFVDAMTGLLLVLMFVLTIFMVIQFVLRETITGQENQLTALTAEVTSLTEALGLAQGRVSTLEQEQERQSNVIAALTADRDAQLAALAEANNRITGFEAQVAGLLAERTDLRDQIAGLGTQIETLEGDKAQLLTEAEALNLALAQARDEIDANEEAARLAAARREALEALLAEMRNKDAEQQSQIATLNQSLGEKTAQLSALDAETATRQERISELEAAMLVDAAAAEALRERLANADTELTAMTLALEEKRKEAEDTLTLLAAANLAKDELGAELDTLRETLVDLRQNTDSQLTEAERQAALLAVANERLAQEKALSAESQRQAALLNEQVAALRTQVATLQEMLNLAEVADRDAQVQIESLGSQLNTALARVAAEERRRAELEEAERIRLEQEAEKLESYRSEFFGELRQVLDGQEGIRIEGDRFVFSSEVLFAPGSATLSPQGRDEIAKAAALLRGVAEEIPENIDWIIRVDGHTDNVPLSGLGEFRNNWELSQARALSVVEFMVATQGIDPRNLAANGFGEYQPINTEETEEARAQNRRIELKLTER